MTPAYPPSGQLADPELSGRAEWLQSWSQHMAQVRAHPARSGPVATVVTGSAGSGKTTLLRAMVTAARDRGCTVVTPSAGGPLADALTEAIAKASPPKSAWQRMKDRFSRISGGGVTVMGVGGNLSWTPPQQNESIVQSTADRLADLTREVARRGGCVVIAIDDLGKRSSQDIEALTQALDSLRDRGEHLPITMVATADPGFSSKLTVASAPQVAQSPLPALSRTDTEFFLRQTAHGHGRGWDDAAVEFAFRESHGNPAFLTALSDAALAAGKGGVVTEAQARAALPTAQSQYASAHLHPTWASLTTPEKAYVATMAVAGGNAQNSELATMIGADVTSMAEVRNSLEAKGLVTVTADNVPRVTDAQLQPYALSRYPQMQADHPQLPTIGQMRERRGVGSAQAAPTTSMPTQAAAQPTTTVPAPPAAQPALTEATRPARPAGQPYPGRPRAPLTPPAIRGDRPGGPAR